MDDFASREQGCHHDSSTSDGTLLPMELGASATTRANRWRRFAFDVQGRAPPEGLYQLAVNYPPDLVSWPEELLINPFKKIENSEECIQ